MKNVKPLPTEGFLCNFSCQIVASIFVFWVRDFKFRRHIAGKFYLSPKCYKLLKDYFPWNWEHKKIFILCKCTNVVKRGRMEGVIIVNVLFIQDASFDKDISDLVWITIGRRSAVLKIAALCLSNISWNSDWTTTVGNTSWEIMDRRSFMQTSQTSFVILAWKKMKIIN